MSWFYVVIVTFMLEVAGCSQLAWLVSDNSALFYVRVCVCVVCLWCNAVFVVKTYIWLISLMQHVFVSAGGSED